MMTRKRRIWSVFLVLVLIVSLAACKSKEERELERAREAAAALEEAAERAREEYDDLIRDIERYENARDRLNSGICLST